MTKRLITKIILISWSFVLGVGILTPTTMYVLNKKSYDEKDKFLFNNQRFKNKQELYNYAQSLAEIDEYNIRENEQWSIDYNNQTKYFKSLDDMYNFLDDKIKIYSTYTSTLLEQNIDGSIPNHQIIDLNLNETDFNKIRIYRGKDNSYFLSEKEAKESYLQIHEGYLFNNTFFRNKEELSSYLNLYYDEIFNNQNENIVLKAPNGELSLPINFNGLTNKDLHELNKLSSFVDLNAKRYLQLITTVQDKKQYFYYDKNDIVANIGNISTFFDNPSYIKINSNQGNANYIIDLNENDENNLFGPYYTKATGALKNIKNKNLWKRLEGDSWLFNDNHKYSNLLAGFMDNIIIEDDEFIHPFGVNEYKQQTTEYFDYLKKESPDVYQNVMNTYNIMKTGKRYSSFYKLPVLFIKTMEELIYTNAKQDIIERTKSYYEGLASVYDSRLYALVPSVFLEPLSSSRYKKLSFVDLFKINDKTFDLNTDIEAFVDILIENYSNFINYLEFIPCVLFYATYLPDVFDYNEKLIRFINKSFIFDKSLNNEYEKIWNMLTTSNSSLFSDSVSSIYYTNTFDKINPDLLEALTHQFVLTKDIFIQNVTLKIKEQLDYFINHNYNDYYDNDQSFFARLSSKTINKYIDLYKFNNYKVDYKIFTKIKLSNISEYLYNNYSSEFGLNIVSYDFKKIKYDDLNYVSTLTNDTINALTSLKNKDNENIANFIVKLFNTSIYDNYFDTLKVDLKEWTKNYNTTKQWISKYDKTLKTIKDVTTNSKIVKCLSNALKPIPYINAAFLFFDFFIPSFNKFSYYFESEGVRYVWNGGSETKILFGLVNITNSSIDDMKINDPLQITKQHINNAYYYNGKEYDDIVDLKTDQLYDILDGKFKYNDSLKQVYTFQNVVNSNSYPLNNVYDKIGVLDFKNDDLIDNVYNAVINRDNKIIANNIFLYSNGYDFDQAYSKYNNIQTLLSNIKPIKIARLPLLKNDLTPISNDRNNLDDGSIPEYQLPGLSWTTSSGFKFHDLNDYVIFDSNMENYNLPESDNIELFKEHFNAKFNVESKDVIKSDLYKHNNYSNYVNNINYLNVYEVISNQQEKKFFIDKSKAIKWLISESNFRTYSSFEEVKYYKFNNILFKDLNSYLEWVLNNSEVLYD